MKTQIKTIARIKPIYREYLDEMSQFYEIDNVDSWCDGALKNLQRYSMADDRYVYILKESDAIIGFALVISSALPWSINTCDSIPTVLQWLSSTFKKIMREKDMAVTWLNMYLNNSQVFGKLPSH